MTAQGAGIDHIRPQGSGQDGQFDGLTVDGEGGGTLSHWCEALLPSSDYIHQLLEFRGRIDVPGEPAKERHVVLFEKIYEAALLGDGQFIVMLFQKAVEPGV